MLLKRMSLVFLTAFVLTWLALVVTFLLRWSGLTDVPNPPSWQWVALLAVFGLLSVITFGFSELLKKKTGRS